MKESYGEGVASHTDPESCGAALEDRVEALTGARADRVFSRERTSLRGAEAGTGCGRLSPAGFPLLASVISLTFLHFLNWFGQ